MGENVTNILFQHSGDVSGIVLMLILFHEISQIVKIQE